MYSYKCVCSRVCVSSLVQDHLWFTCELRQCGALWFPAPQLLFFLSLPEFILCSLSHSQTTALTPHTIPRSLLIQFKMSDQMLRGLTSLADFLISVVRYARRKPRHMLNTFEWGPWIYLIIIFFFPSFHPSVVIYFHCSLCSFLPLGFLIVFSALASIASWAHI